MLNLDERPIKNDRAEDVPREDYRRERHTHPGLWAAFATLLAVLAMAGAYGYRTLKANQIEIGRVPGMLRSLSGVNERLGAAERALSAWASGQQQLQERVSSFEKKFGNSLQKARQHTDQVTAALEERVMSGIEERNVAVDARLAGMELENAKARRELTQLQQELASTRQEFASVRQETDQKIANLRVDIAGNDHATEAVAQRLERQRVDFEATRNRTTEVAPGIALNVADTDVSHQQFSGWIQILPEARFLWVNEHGIQRPVPFYRQKDGERFDVVATRVGRDFVVGYVLIGGAQSQNVETPMAQAGKPTANPELTLRGGK